MRKSEHTTYIGVLLFSASPKCSCTPLGGDPAGVLDNCSGFSSAKPEDIFDLCSDTHTARGTDASCKESEIGLFFLIRNRQ